MTHFAKMFKAMGDENRMRILAALYEETYCVCDLAKHLGIPQPTLSHHLKILRETGLVNARKDGQWIYCSLNRAMFEEHGLDFDRLFSRFASGEAVRG